MAVGTGIITLSEVIANVAGTQTSLQDCIDDAIAGAYDLTYYTAPATSLAEFRGYDEVGAITPTMTLSPPDRSDLTSLGGTTTFSILSNTSWSITDNATWITISPTSGTGNGTITVTYASNGTGSPRTGIVTATTTAGSPTASDSSTVNQLSGFE